VGEAAKTAHAQLLRVAPGEVQLHRGPGGGPPGTTSPVDIGQLYDQYRGLAFTLAYRILGDAGAAEDVVQEAFLAVWRARTTFNQSRGSVRTWVCTIVRHQALDRGRRKRGQSANEGPIEALHAHDSRADTWTAVVGALDRRRLAAAMSRLPEEQRNTIGLSFLQGYTHIELSHLMGVPLGTVKGRLRVGLRHLRQDLDEARVPS
jgi:RNA polymerase sigma-70 factor (ECF subfamily)